MKVHRISWIGVKSPLEDDRIVYRKLIGAYTPDEVETLEAVAEIVSPLIVQEGHTGRLLGPRQGLSRTYQWGPRPGTFVQDVAEVDVDRLFAMPDGAEFRDLDNPEHDERKPEVPWHYVDAVLHRILMQAHNGPGVFLTGVQQFTNGKALIRALQERDTGR